MQTLPVPGSELTLLGPQNLRAHIVPGDPFLPPSDFSRLVCIHFFSPARGALQGQAMKYELHNSSDSTYKLNVLVFTIQTGIVQYKGKWCNYLTFFIYFEQH